MESFIKIPDSVLLDKRLNHTHMILYGVILSRANNEDNCCFATNQALWNRIGRNKDTVSNLVKDLKKFWYIEVIEWSLRKILPILKIEYSIPKFEYGYTQNWVGVYPNLSTIQDNIQDNIQDKKINKKDSKTSRHQSSSRWTTEQEEKFETFWKIYPHYQSRSVKKRTKTHFFEKDYDEMLFSAKMLKRYTIMRPDKAEFVPWAQKWVNNFDPLTEYQKKQKIRELYRRHMTAWWDMKTRMDEIVTDFPDVDFSEFREELSKEKTEYAIWAFIHGR